MVPFAPDEAIFSSSSEPSMWTMGRASGDPFDGDVTEGRSWGGLSSLADFLEQAELTRNASMRSEEDERGPRVTAAH